MARVGEERPVRRRELQRKGKSTVSDKRAKEGSSICRTKQGRRQGGGRCEGKAPLPPYRRSWGVGARGLGSLLEPTESAQWVWEELGGRTLKLGLELRWASLVISSVILVALLLYTSVSPFVKEQSQLLSGGVPRVNEAVLVRTEQGLSKNNYYHGIPDGQASLGRAFGLRSPAPPRPPRPPPRSTWSHRGSLLEAPVSWWWCLFTHPSTPQHPRSCR